MKLLTLAEVAERLHCSHSKVKMILQHDGLPSISGIARGRLVAEADLDDWIAARARRTVEDKRQLALRLVASR